EVEAVAVSLVSKRVEALLASGIQAARFREDLAQRSGIAAVAQQPPEDQAVRAGDGVAIFADAEGGDAAAQSHVVVQGRFDLPEHLRGALGIDGHIEGSRGRARRRALQRMHVLRDGGRDGPEVEYDVAARWPGLPGGIHGANITEQADS